MTLQGSQRLRTCMAYRVESFPNVFVEAAWARRGNAELCSVYLIMHACWDEGEHWTLASCVRSAAGLLRAACCALRVSCPATQLCDRGDLGKPSVTDKEDMLLPMIESVQS